MTVDTREVVARVLRDMDRDLRRAEDVGYVVIPSGRAGVYRDTLHTLDSAALTWVRAWEAAE